ncbi:MAG: hypothetical protein ACRDQ7_27900 [Haloechinothrix sp.]
MSGTGLPWRDGDLVMVCLTAIAGLAAIVAAWFGASGTVSVVRQAAWLNVAVAGFAISAVGLCLWLLRLRRAIGERRVALISLDPVEDATPVAAAPTAEFELVRASGMSKVHFADCPLVVGKPVQPAYAGDGEPCGVCAA